MQNGQKRPNFCPNPGPPSKESGITSTKMSDLITRAWNGTPIARRTTDGFVNATAMCRANDKRWANYWQTDRAGEYAEALSEETGIPVSQLVQIRHGNETWIHPQVAVDLARWISAPFAVFMDRWFLEVLEQRKIQETQPAIISLPPAKAIRDAAEGLVFIWDALETRGLADDRDRIELKRDLKVLHSAMVHTTAGFLPGTSSVLTKKDLLPRFQGRAVDVDAPLSIVEFAAAYLQDESNVVNKYDSELGRAVAPLYRERHAAEPMTTTHLSIKAEEARQRGGLGLFGGAKNGVAVTPKIYLPRDWDLIIRALRTKGIIQPDRAAELMAELQQFRPTEA